MKVIKNIPEVVTPPATYDLIGMSQDEMDILTVVLGMAYSAKDETINLALIELYKRCYEVNGPVLDLKVSTTFTVERDNE